ncbi:PA2169 family four-helix-bundle protein [Gallaecimonas mangrovi]|uniref:PA2169 family four-helix-bundle protein n=1 Tax=Gallaecimonas mangrovi TaxID=2291597 RepID=UPI000E209DBF|nr:PA2169 family four-helix-bundle protein [Gallaecimonas mangrovi]
MFGTHDSRLVNELIAVCVDGRQFYQYAAKQVDDSDLKSLFRDMAHIRADIVRDLSSKVEDMGEKADHRGTLAGSMQTVYTELRAQLSDDAKFQYVTELEEAENRTLCRFKEGVRELESKPLARDVADCLATIQLTHDRMKAIKDGLSARKH